MTGITERTQIEHGRYEIVGALRHGKARAIAFFPKGVKVAEAPGETVQEAIDAVIATLEGVKAEWIGKRRMTDHGFAVPLPEEYAEALQAIRMNDKERRMLATHAAAGEAGLTATQLARGGGYDTWSAANLTYGGLGKKVADVLGLEAPGSLKRRGRAVQTGVLAWSPDATMDGDNPDLHDEAASQWVWQMYPELREALESLNMATPLPRT